MGILLTRENSRFLQQLSEKTLGLETELLPIGNPFFQLPAFFLQMGDRFGALDAGSVQVLDAFLLLLQFQFGVMPLKDQVVIILDP